MAATPPKRLEPPQRSRGGPQQDDPESITPAGDVLRPSGRPTQDRGGRALLIAPRTWEDPLSWTRPVTSSIALGFPPAANGSARDLPLKVENRESVNGRGGRHARRAEVEL